MAESASRDRAGQIAGGVLDGVGAALDGVEAAFRIDEGLARLSGDGDALRIGVSAAAGARVELGGAAMYGAGLVVTRNGDGSDATYTVAATKHALAAITGTIPIPNLPLNGEIAAQSLDRVEMTFAGREDAARAATLLQKLAMADAAGDAGTLSALAGAGSLPPTRLNNPMANPLNDSGAPGADLQMTAGLTEADREFLQANITAFEQRLGVRGRAAIDAKLPQLASILELAVDGRLDGRRQLIRRVDLPGDAAPGSLSYTLSEDVRLTGKEKAVLGINVANQVVVGPQVQNLFDIGSSRIGVTARFDIPAGTEVTTSPAGGRAVPEVDVYSAGGLRSPDNLSVALDAEWRDETLATVARGDSNRAKLTFDMAEPSRLPAAVSKFVNGDPVAAARTADVTVTGVAERIERIGLTGQAGVTVKLLEGIQADVNLIVDAGIDDVVGRRRFDLSAAPAAPDAPADPVPDLRLVVLPQSGLNLRDAPGGERSAILQNGTFLDQTGPAVLSDDGTRWVPVRGTDAEDRPVSGFVASEFTRRHDVDRGEMDATGRTAPRAEHARFREITVRAGDTLWDIAAREGVDFRETVALNRAHLIETDLIFAGDTVYVPGTARAPGHEPPDVVETESRLLVTSETQGDTRIDMAESVPRLPVSNGGPTAMQPPSAPVAQSGEVDARSHGPMIPPRDGPSVEVPTTSAPVDRPTGPTTGSDADLDRILHDYQVPGSPQTTWRPSVTPEWADGPARWAGETLDWMPGIGPMAERVGQRMAAGGFEIRVLESEKALLDELGPTQQIEWALISEASMDDAAAAYPQPAGNDMRRIEWANNGHTDAYRHALWNARMTRAFGADWTEAFATAHERAPGNEATREAMDLFNNEVGRRIALENLGAEDAVIEGAVADALRDGELLVLDAGGNLQWSDNVAYGEHGQPQTGPLAPNGAFLDRAMAREETDS